VCRRGRYCIVAIRDTDGTGTVGCTAPKPARPARIQARGSRRAVGQHWWRARVVRSNGGLERAVPRARCQPSAVAHQGLRHTVLIAAHPDGTNQNIGRPHSSNDFIEREILRSRRSRRRVVERTCVGRARLQETPKSNCARSRLWWKRDRAQCKAGSKDCVSSPERTSGEGLFGVTGQRGY
jgi:hypothetical protein